ncbi:hypothetical protein THAOC_26032, partial [Thalassiosira oceanica]
GALANDCHFPLGTAESAGGSAGGLLWTGIRWLGPLAGALHGECGSPSVIASPTKCRHFVDWLLIWLRPSAQLLGLFCGRTWTAWLVALDMASYLGLLRQLVGQELAQVCSGFSPDLRPYLREQAYKSKSKSSVPRTGFSVFYCRADRRSKHGQSRRGVEAEESERSILPQGPS